VLLGALTEAGLAASSDAREVHEAALWLLRRLTAAPAIALGD
jgi:hypothetical protein